MIINGYDTTVGSRFKVKDKATETIRMLQSSDKLELVDQRGVYAISHKNDYNLPPFIFPISTQNYMREKVTIFDQRPYINKEGRNVNLPEYNVMLLAACLQQDLQNNQTTLIKSVRPFTIKAFANAMGRKLERMVMLDMNQSMIVRVILAYYYVCLLENSRDDFSFVAQNSIHTALRFPIPFIQETIKDLGFVNTLPELLNALTTHPALQSLSRLDLPGLVQAGTTIFFSTSGFKQLTGAALEMPALFTALCWGAATQRIYQNTMIGEELNVKQDKRVETFISTVSYYFKSA